MKQQIADNKLLKTILQGSSPEAQEMRDIFLRMIDAEVKLIKNSQNSPVCPGCGKANSF